MKNIVRYFFIAVFMATFLGCALMKFPLKKTKRGGTWVPAGVDSLVAVEAGAKADQLFVSKERKHQAEEFMESGRQNMELSESLWNSLQDRKVRDIKRLEQIKRQQESSVSDSTKAQDVVVKINNEGKLEEITAKDIAPRAQIDTSFYTLVDTLILAYMDRSAEDFMEARRANPYDIETHRMLFDFYDRMVYWYSDTTISAKEAGELERFIEIDKGLDDVFSRLGKNYEANDNWPKAYENYKQALDVFLVTPLLADTSDSGTIAIDTLADRRTLLRYLWDKGRAEAKLAANKNYLQEVNLPHLADSALVSFSRALKIAVSSKELWDWIEPLKRQIRWVGWDNLNVLASEKREAARNLMRLKKFKEAEKEYQELLNLVKTRKARSEVLCELAELEFYDLEERDQGINRILTVVKNLDSNPSNSEFYDVPFTDTYLDTAFIKTTFLEDSTFLVSWARLPGSVKPGASSSNSPEPQASEADSARFPAPLPPKATTKAWLDSVYLANAFVDSTYRVCFKNAGQMCLNYGNLERQQGRFETARRYYQLGINIDWMGRGKCYLNLARLSLREPREGLKLCQKALSLQNQLKREEIVEAFGLMITFLQNSRRPELARFVYDQFNNLRAGGVVAWSEILSIRL